MCHANPWVSEHVCQFLTPELEEALVNKRLNRNLLRLLLIDTLAEKEVAFKDALMEKELALKEKDIVINGIR